MWREYREREYVNIIRTGIHLCVGWRTTNKKKKCLRSHGGKFRLLVQSFEDATTRIGSVHCIAKNGRRMQLRGMWARSKDSSERCRSFHFYIGTRAGDAVVRSNTVGNRISRDAHEAANDTRFPKVEGRAWACGTTKALRMQCITIFRGSTSGGEWSAESGREAKTEGRGNKRADYDTLMEERKGTRKGERGRTL